MSLGFEKLSVIIVAGGKSSRFGGDNKLLQKLYEVPVFIHSLRIFSEFISRENLILVVPQDDKILFEEAISKTDLSEKFVYAIGGKYRCKSVQSGLNALKLKDGYVAIHDAARPLITKELVSNLYELAKEYGGAIPGKLQVNTLKRVDDNCIIEETIPRDKVFAVETPQIFDLKKLQDAYNIQSNLDLTDDAAIFCNANNSCKIFENPFPNDKITFSNDIKRIENQT